MTKLSSAVFSEYEVAQMNVIFANGDYGTVECMGSFEEEMAVKNVSKKCRGVVTKNRTMGTGAGTGKVTAHMPYEIYYKLHDMGKATLASGVKAYGYNSMHPEVCITMDVFDEDGVEKYKAYPCAVVSTGPARKVENGADEVAECELEFAFSPDANGFGMYEALANDLASGIKTNWMTAFQPSLVAASTVMSVSATHVTVAKSGNTTVTVSNASGTPSIFVTQEGSGVTATLSTSTLTIAANSSAKVGTAWVHIVDEAGAEATIVVDVTSA